MAIIILTGLSLESKRIVVFSLSNKHSDGAFHCPPPISNPSGCSLELRIYKHLTFGRAKDSLDVEGDINKSLEIQGKLPECTDWIG